MSVFKEKYIESPEVLAKNDKVVQVFLNERYDVFAIFNSGRIFKKRARGQSGAYDNWVEYDIVAEIKQDLKI